MADVVLQAPTALPVPHTQPDLIHDDDDMQAASPQESDLVPTPSDDPIHFSPTSLSPTKHSIPNEDIDMNDDADGDRDVDDDDDDDNISVDMDIGSPAPTSTAPVVQAPPSPAPSGDSSTKQTLVQRSPAATVGVSLNGYTNPDHPEHSIPSPASPTAASLPVEPSLPVPALEEQPQAQLPVTAPAAALSPAAKHEQEDADAMHDQRPSKRARTADIASVSVFSLYLSSHFIFLPRRLRRRALFCSGVRHPVFRPCSYRRTWGLSIKCHSCIVLQCSDGASFTCTYVQIFTFDLHRAPSTKKSNQINYHRNLLSLPFLPDLLFSSSNNSPLLPPSQLQSLHPLA